MLMIEGKYGESIRINDDIKINILVTRSCVVKIGVEAPRKFGYIGKRVTIELNLNRTKPITRG